MNISTAIKSSAPVIWLKTNEVGTTLSDISSLLPSLVDSDTKVIINNLSLGFHDALTKEPCIAEKYHISLNATSEERHEREILDKLEDLLIDLIFKDVNSYVVILGDEATGAGLAPVLIDLYKQYHESFLNKEMYLGPRILLVVHEEENIPPVISDILTVASVSSPDRHALASLLETMLDGNESLCEHPAEVIQSGLGLSLNAFRNACFDSISNTQSIDPTFIEEKRKASFKANSLLEIVKPNISLDHIGGLDYAKKLINHIVWTQQNPEEARELEIPVLHRILMVGVPGTGKSAICEATASTLQRDLAKIGMGKVFDRFIGESERKARETFEHLHILAPIVAWIDEFGRDFSVGDYQGDAGTSSRVQAEFLTGLQELREDVLLMAAANRIDLLAPEILRAERFDKILFVGFPTESERQSIFRVHLNNSEDFDYEALAEKSSTFTGAEIKSLIREVRSSVSIDHKRKINTQDLLDGIPLQKNRMWLKHSAEIAKMYSKAMDEWDWASSQQKADAELVMNALGYRKNKPSKTLVT